MQNCDRRQTHQEARLNSSKRKRAEELFSQLDPTTQRDRERKRLRQEIANAQLEATASQERWMSAAMRRQQSTLQAEHAARAVQSNEQTSTELTEPEMMQNDVVQQPTRDDYMQDYMAHLKSSEHSHHLARFENWRMEKANGDKTWAAECEKRKARHAAHALRLATKKLARRRSCDLVEVGKYL